MTFVSILAATVRTAYLAFDYATARQVVRHYAQTGRVGFEAADKTNGGVAQVLVDGERVGQASRLLVGMEYADLATIKGYK